MTKFKCTTLAAATAILVSAAAPADAYTLLNPVRKWVGRSSTKPLYIYVYNVGNNTIADPTKGTWRIKNVIGTWKIVEGRMTNKPAVRGDGRPTIHLNTNGGICSGSCLAATLTGYYRRNANGTYRITDADVYTNQQYAYQTAVESGGCNNEFYMEAIQVHEVGHVIGLGHSNVGGSTMYPSIGTCSYGAATLSNDDRNGENRLYRY